MKSLLLSLVLVSTFAVFTRAAEKEPAVSADDALTDLEGEARAAASVVNCGGQNYQLFRSDADGHLETDEYRLSSEMSGAWSESVLVQRLTVNRTTSPAELADFIRNKEGDKNGIKVSIDALGVHACVFNAEEDDASGVPILRIVGLVLDVAGEPGRLLVIQHSSQSPSDGKISSAGTIAWRERFLRQARAANTISEASRP